MLLVMFCVTCMDLAVTKSSNSYFFSFFPQGKCLLR